LTDKIFLNDFKHNLSFTGLGYKSNSDSNEFVFIPSVFCIETSKASKK